jgi:hypothetical protein
MTVCCGAPQLWAAPATTTTTLVMTSGGNAVASGGSVAAGSQVTLTAAVTAGSANLNIGQINFCDASVTYCTDIHRLGTAQLISAGTAVFRFYPGIGSHSYKAVFAGTPNGAVSAAASTSSPVVLTVTGAFPTTTAIAATGSAGNYSLTATVTGLVNSPSAPAPTGSVSFLDTNDSSVSLGTAPLSAGTSALSLFNSASPATLAWAQSVAAADFNGDGKLDLIVPVYAVSDASILLGNGDGTFTAGPGLPLTNSNANNAAIADFNGDGNVDIALSLPDTSQVQVLLGNGDGSFTAMTPISAGPVYAVAAADLNGDGKPDLIESFCSTSSLSILLGNGDGTFTQGSTPTLLTCPTSVAMGDFNGDGIPDLAATFPMGTGVQGAGEILLGNGDGTFTQVPGYFRTGDSPISIAAGDFNGDGILDLAVANTYSGTTLPSTVTVLIGKGDGTFTPTAVSPVTGSFPYSVAVGDFNGDGKADIVTANSVGNTATVLLGNGDGTFAAPLSPAAGKDPVGVATGDFNGDGLTDVAVANNNAGSVTVLLSQQTQTATASATHISPVGTGNHQVDASYPGDSNFSASISATTGVTALQVTPLPTVTPASSSITTVQALSVTIAVPASSIGPTPTGTVTLTSGSYSSVATSLTNGSVTIAIPAASLPVGTDTLTASYSGDTGYLATTATASVAVSSAQTTPTVTPASSSIGTAQTLSVTIAVPAAGAGPTPTGTVTLTSGTYSSVATGLTNGSVTIGIPATSLAVGADTLTASYSGDAIYSAATATAPVTVATSTFSIAGTAVSVAPGATTGNTSTITVTPAGNFTGRVALTAVVTSSPTGVLYPPTLGFSSTTPVSITGAAAGTATLTVSTTAATSSALVYPEHPGVPWYAAGGTALACILFFGIPARRRSWRNLLGMLALLVTLSWTMVACSGESSAGSSKSGSGGASNPGTTAGSYTVTVSATSGAITQTCVVTLTVQ